MSDTAALHDRLLEVESAARTALAAARNTHGAVPASVALKLASLGDALKRLDSTRDAVRARQKLEGRWTG